MTWNWELPDWPKFNFNVETIANQERQFLLGVGGTFAYLKSINEQEYNQFIVCRAARIDETPSFFNP